MLPMVRLGALTQPPRSQHITPSQAWMDRASITGQERFGTDKYFGCSRIPPATNLGIGADLVSASITHCLEWSSPTP